MKIFKIDIPFVYLKYSLSILLILLIIVLILWIIFSYYIFKWLKIRFRDYTFSLKDYNKKSCELINKFGNCTIKRIYLVKHPVADIGIILFNFAKFNKYKNCLSSFEKKMNTKYYKIFHSMIYIEVEISNKESKLLSIDKNNCIRISSRIKTNDNYKIRDISIKKNKFTLNNILETTRKRIGNDKFFNWEIYNNNCQVFIKEILITLKKFTKSNKQFIYQNVFTDELKIYDFCLHIVYSIVNIWNILENVIGISLL